MARGGSQPPKRGGMTTTAYCFAARPLAYTSRFNQAAELESKVKMAAVDVFPASSVLPEHGVAQAVLQKVFSGGLLL